MKRIENVAIFGMGALGSALAKQISALPDVRLYGIVREIEAYWGAPIIVDGSPLRVNYRSIETMPGVPMDLILLAVRSYDFRTAASSIRPLVGPQTLILPLTYGLGRARLLSDLYGSACVVPAAMPGMQVSRNSRFVTVERQGVLWFGPGAADRGEDMQALRAFWERCGVRCSVGRNMDALVWKSFMLESVCGLTSLVFQLPCGQIAQNERARKVMREAQREIAAVALACGVQVEKAGLPSCEEYLASLPADSSPRMLQDYWQNHRLETDAFCADYLRLAEEKKIPTPAGSWLREQVVKMTEKRGDVSVQKGQIRSLSSRQGLAVTPEIIASQLRIDIMQGKYPAGSKLAENELAAQFYASRSSVRSALQILSGEGLIRTLPNGRREVCRFTEKELRDLFDMRYHLERMALDILLKNSDTVYPSLVEVLGRIEKKYRTQSAVEEPEDLDVLFHRSLVRSADNMFLLNSWDNIARLWYATIYFTGRDREGTRSLMELFGKHRYIYELILARDGAAVPELKRHIEEEKERAAAVLGTFGG